MRALENASLTNTYQLLIVEYEPSDVDSKLIETTTAKYQLSLLTNDNHHNLHSRSVRLIEQTSKSITRQ